MYLLKLNLTECEEGREPFMYKEFNTLYELVQYLFKENLFGSNAQVFEEKQIKIFLDELGCKEQKNEQ